MDRAISLEARRVDLSIELPFLLGRARVDPPAHELTIRRKSERMQPQTMKVLVALHDKSGQVVTRDELVDRCCDGRIVGDDVINRCILLLRRFAEESRGFRIETVPRAGYRLIESDSAHPKERMRRGVGAFIALALVVAGVAGWAWFGRQRVNQGVPPAPSIAVVPFTAEANDALTRQVAVAAPISVEHMMSESGFESIRGASSVRDAVGSDYIFSGNVRRTAASIEATVQLVSQRDGTIAFAHDFSTPVAAAGDLPDRIGATAAAELAWIGAQMALDPNEHLSPELRSELMSTIRLTIEDGDSLRAYQLNRHAAGAAPNSGFAQLGFAVQTGFSLASIPEGERVEALALGRRAAERARSLAPEVGDGYLSWCMLHSPVRMVECDAWVHKSLQIDPSSSFPPGYLSTLFYNAGRYAEALPLARQSIANDPYKPAKIARMIRMLEGTGQSSEAEQFYRQGRRLWPDSGRMRAARLVGLAEAGNYEGLAAFADPAIDGPMIDVAAFKALLQAQRKKDLAGAQRACGSQGISDFTLRLCMTILADLGDFERSFAIAANLYPAWRAPAGADEDRFWLDHLGGFDTALLDAPASKSMRTDPRFLSLADKLGLVVYWLKDGLPDFCRTPQPEPVCAKLRGWRHT